jgi:hypothetical protein
VYVRYIDRVRHQLRADTDFMCTTSRGLRIAATARYEDASALGVVLWRLARLQGTGPPNAQAHLRADQIEARPEAALPKTARLVQRPLGGVSSNLSRRASLRDS